MQTVTGTFQAGQSLSDPINVTGTLTGIGIPADWTPAILSFQISPDSGTNWFDLMDLDNSEVMFNVTPGTMLAINAGSALDNKMFFKLRSGTRAYPVVQTGQRTISLVSM